MDISLQILLFVAVLILLAKTLGGLGARVGLPVERLQHKPLKDPRTGNLRDAWHWDLGGPFLPPR